MGFKKIKCVCYCSDDGCSKMYEWDGKDNNILTKDIILPCGHKCAYIIFDGMLIKKACDSNDMLEYLVRNNMIKYSAYDKVSELGGSIEKCIVPVRDLTDEEQEIMDWE